ncbi:DNA cytosine methyltransferase [Streptococcus suis]|uniref:DNA cytosine methyltransferase n=1 Tax=Streptococcus suis TaxID=1307 RepID=UPI00192DB055|nr:DNA cytosine methyltransferase [Streptococcus suis]MBL6440605.1 DNA cytosine methyltransferase [Streptococcus suis]
MIFKEKIKSFTEKSSYYWDGDPILKKKLNNDTHEKYTLVDICCGAGGLSKGLSDTNKITPILGVDIFTEALKTYELNNPNTSTILGDVRQITDELYQEAIGIQQVDIVAAGVPCQGFSLANLKRNVEDERNFLFLEVIRFINLFNPKVVVIENVSGMRLLKNGEFEKAIAEALSSAGDFGYKVKRELLNAADFGVPQIRKRLIFVAIRNDIESEFHFPNPKFGTSDRPYRTIRDAIGDLPKLNNNDEVTKYSESPQTQYQVEMRANSNIETLNNHKSPKHPESTIAKIRETTPGKPMYKNYKQRIRLAWDIQSPTQLAGGIRPQFQFGHPDQPRGLSVRERARIQSFPDDFIFVGGVVQGRVQTGNAVPPLLAYSVAQELLKTLGEKNG